MPPFDQPLIKVLETDDVDAQRQSLPGWDQDYAQLSAGRFRGRTTDVDFGPVRVFREQLSTRIEQLFVPPVGTATFCLHMGDSLPSRVDGKDVGGETFCLLSGGRECHAVTDQRSDVMCIEVGEALLPPGAVRDTLIARQPNSVLRAGRAPHMAWWLASVLDNCIGGRIAPAGSDDMEVLADLVVEGCRTLIDEGVATDRPRDGRAARFDLVMRARELALEALPEVLEVGELAAGLRVSDRLLEESFRDIVGMGPATWLRVQRLNRAHRDLRLPGRRDVTVAEIATRWGFWHLGRFSGFYRDLFGCSPSQTLRSGAASTAVTSRRNCGSKSVSNQELARCQAVVRQLGCGNGTRAGQ